MNFTLNLYELSNLVLNNYSKLLYNYYFSIWYFLFLIFFFNIFFLIKVKYTLQNYFFIILTHIVVNLIFIYLLNILIHVFQEDCFLLNGHVLLFLNIKQISLLLVVFYCYAYLIFFTYHKTVIIANSLMFMGMILGIVFTYYLNSLIGIFFMIEYLTLIYFILLIQNKLYKKIFKDNFTNQRKMIFYKYYSCFIYFWSISYITVFFYLFYYNISFRYEGLLLQTHYSLMLILDDVIESNTFYFFFIFFFLKLGYFPLFFWKLIFIKYIVFINLMIYVFFYYLPLVLYFIYFINYFFFFLIEFYKTLICVLMFFFFNIYVSISFKPTTFVFFLAISSILNGLLIIFLILM